MRICWLRSVSNGALIHGDLRSHSASVPRNYCVAISGLPNRSQVAFAGKVLRWLGRAHYTNGSMRTSAEEAICTASAVMVLGIGGSVLSSQRTARSEVATRVSLSAQRSLPAKGVCGDLEMDLILGATPDEAILTIVDRKTDYIFIELLPQGRKSKPLARAVNRRLGFLKRRGQLHSITTDNGTEFSAYRSIERSLGVPVYFARPYRLTDKPHIEHANTLIRQYLLKHGSFASLTEKEVKEIEWSLNNHPRKKLGYRTPYEVFYLNLQTKCCTS